MQNKTISTAAAMPAVIRAIMTGDLVDTGNCGINAQDCADAAGYLLARANRFDAMHGTAAGTTRVVTGTPSSISPHAVGAPPAEWVQYSLRAWQNVTIGGGLYIPIEVPNGATITGASVTIDPAGAHVGLPAQMPELQLVKRAHSTGVSTDVGTAGVDGSASVVAYEAAHQVTKTALTEVINNATHLYFLQLTAEAGANALVGTIYTTATVTYTPA